MIVLGPRELPKMGRTLGNAVREFRKASSGITAELGLDKLLEEEKPKEQG
ncbi:MAG: twin-arginine translocase TatA/TatE family subunit [Clostridia bacterium]|nr:MAG: twin-arginine translocase TatA/TatE family subunit [Clostridia bacterium]